MNPTREELALLPPYCTHVQLGYGATPEGYARWKSIYGETFHALHHYCYALIYLMRADRHGIPASVRDHHLSNAFQEIQYVIERSPRDHVLRTEMLTKQGMIMRRLNKLDEAISLLKQATELDRAYWRSYYELAKCHLARNRKDEAREALQEGLIHAPNARGLVAMLDELDGNRRAKQHGPAATSSDAARARGSQSGERSDER